MARSRNIKPGFFLNEVLSNIPYETRLLFIGLWTIADKKGRLEDRPKRIKISCLPYDNIDIDQTLNDLCINGFIERYEVENKPYIQIVNWLRHQNPHHKEVDSIIPDAPDSKKLSLKEIKLIEPANIHKTIREYIFDRDGNRCVFCSSVDNLSMDHILTQQEYGLHVPGNLRVLCQTCNSARPTQGKELEAELFESGLSIIKLKKICIEEWYKIQELGHEQFMHEHASIKHNHTQTKQNASCPTDSLNLIPDSLQNKGRFAPPNISEVKAYILEKGLVADCEQFIDFYASKGWMVGKNKMKDWKAALRNWSKRGQSNGTHQQGNRQNSQSGAAILAHECSGAFEPDKNTE